MQIMNIIYLYWYISISKGFPYISGESFELKETNKPLEKKIMELEAQAQILERTSSDKDVPIEKYKMETKEGKCLSYSVMRSVLIYT